LGIVSAKPNQKVA